MLFGRLSLLAYRFVFCARTPPTHTHTHTLFIYLFILFLKTEPAQDFYSIVYWCLCVVVL